MFANHELASKILEFLCAPTKARCAVLKFSLICWGTHGPAMDILWAAPFESLIPLWSMFAPLDLPYPRKPEEVENYLSTVSNFGPGEARLIGIHRSSKHASMMIHPASSGFETTHPV